MLRFVPHPSSTNISVQYNFNEIGELYHECDGYYVFEPIRGRIGYWSAWVMREIADHLDFLNKAWDEEVKTTIAGLCARTDYTNDPWFSPAGFNCGQIKNVVKLAHNPYVVTFGGGYIKGWCVFKKHPDSELMSLASVKFLDKTDAECEAIRLNNQTHEVTNV